MGVTVDDIQEQILAAAEERFSRYGFAKTTMAEIARDCHMSAGNIYRFFSNKEEIGARIACRCMADREQIGREIVGRERLSASERLETFVAEICLNIHAVATHELLKSDLVEYISEKRWDLVTAHVATLRSLVAQILEAGVRRDEFAVSDIDGTAESILTALKGLLYPRFITDLSPADLEIKGRALARLLIKGLRK